MLKAIKDFNIVLDGKKYEIKVGDTVPNVIHEYVTESYVEEIKEAPVKVKKAEENTNKPIKKAEAK